MLAKKVSQKWRDPKKSASHGAMKIDKNLLSLLSLQNEFGYFFKENILSKGGNLTNLVLFLKCCFIFISAEKLENLFGEIFIDWELT